MGEDTGNCLSTDLYEMECQEDGKMKRKNKEEKNKHKCSFIVNL
jgi:hypothetical protein